MFLKAVFLPTIGERALTRNFRETVSKRAGSIIEDLSQGNNQATNSIDIAYLLGTLENTEIARFQRLLFRMSRGTAFTTVQQMDLEVLKSIKHLKQNKSRSVVMIVFRNGRDRTFRDKLLTLCQSFNMRFYEYNNPAEAESRMKMNSLSEKADDTLKVGYKSQSRRLIIRSLV